MFVYISFLGFKSQQESNVHGIKSWDTKRQYNEYILYLHKLGSGFMWLGIKHLQVYFEIDMYIVNLFVTSKKIVATNSPIHEFKVLQNVFSSLQNEKARLKMFLK